MTQKLSIISFAIACFSLPATAHDFWLQPTEFAPEAAGSVTIHAKVGHADDISEWPAEYARVSALRSYNAEGVKDQQAGLKAKPSQGVFDIQLASGGAHVLALESSRAVSSLKPEKFNEYIIEEGLVPVILHRQQNRLQGKDGREVYSRRGKTIIQVGDRHESDTALVTAPIGLTLEITPTSHPMDLKADDRLTVAVTYRGEAVSGATLHIVNLDPSIGDVEKIRTDANGQATLSPLAEGDWMLQTIWASPITSDARGDYDTVFSSLSFSTRGSNKEQ